MGNSDAEAETQESQWFPSHTRVYVTSLPPDKLLALVENYVCMGGLVPPVKRMLSDLPLAGQQWGDGFSVWLNRPSQLSVSASIDWDGINSTILLSMRKHAWVMPICGFLTCSIIFWSFTQIGDMLVGAMIALGWLSVVTALFMVHLRQGNRVMDMMGAVLERVSNESQAKFWRLR